jgi:hypothetical protein
VAQNKQKGCMWPEGRQFEMLQCVSKGTYFQIFTSDFLKAFTDIYTVKVQKEYYHDKPTKTF